MVWKYAILAVGVAAFLMAAAWPAAAQGVMRGKVTDEWNNPIPNVRVTAVPSTRIEFGGLRGDDADQEAREWITDQNGEFFERGFRPGSIWNFEYHADGYVSGGREELIPRGFDPYDIRYVLQVDPSANRFRGTRIYESKEGMPIFTFAEDGTFSFKEAAGEGHGTYGIVDRTVTVDCTTRIDRKVILVIRDYDGPDDKYNLAIPIDVPFYSSTFPSFIWDDVQLRVR